MSWFFIAVVGGVVTASVLSGFIWWILCRVRIEVVPYDRIQRIEERLSALEVKK